MKKTRIYWFYLLAVVGIISLLPGSCKKQDVPVLTTSEIVSVSSDTAGIGGAVVDDGGSVVTDRGICWSTSSSPTTADSKLQIGTGIGSFSGILNDLSPNTAYYVRAYAVNGVGTAYGNEVSFNTLADLASITTLDVSEITTSGAIAGGSILDDGGADITEKGICWSTSSEPTIESSKAAAGSGSDSFTGSMKDLLYGTVYYVRAYATNSAGTVYGDEVSFITSELANKAYTLTTTAITSITSSSASSGGTISGTGDPIIARGVCWSTSTGPTLADSYTSDGSGTGSYSSSLTGLSASTTYYVRAYASTSRGTGYGDELYFTTSAGSPVVPTLSTTTVTNITSSTASSGGNITSDGGASVTARGVCWSTSQNPTLSDSYTTDGTGTGSYSSSLTSLSASTTYYVRAYATNSVGTAYGDQKSFSTSSGSATTPTVTTSSITNISCYSASGGGNVTDDGGASVTARGVCWSTSQNPTTSNSHTTDGTGTGSYSSSLTSLSLNTTYYVRAYATNSEGTSYGDQVSFSTTYYLTTTAISNITSSTASSGGNIYCDGGSAVTARGVCWSTSQNPTLSDSHTTDGTGTGSFTSSITGLSASTTYYVRAYGTNSSGSAYGNQVSFTTSAATGLPTLTTTTITNITTSTASSGGNITSDGGYSVTARGVCWSTSQNPTLSDSYTTDGSGTGSYSSSLTSLSSGTLYYVRAYATNSQGTAYGNQQSFTTSSGSVDVSVTKYRDDKTIALSLFFDDSTPGQATYGVPAFNSRSLKGTWFVNPGSTEFSNYDTVWADTDDIEDQELANHGYTHSSCSTESCVDDEVGLAAEAIWDIRGEADFTSLMSWNRGGGTSWPEAYLATVLSTYLCIDRINNGGEQMYAQPISPGTSASSMISTLNSFISTGTYCRFSFHGITSVLGDPPSTTNESAEFPINNGAVWTTDLYELLDSVVIRQNQGDVWVGGVIEVYKYIRERLTSSVSISANGADSYNVTLTTTLDTDYYDELLTVEVTGLTGWNTCQVSQGGNNENVSVSGGVALIEGMPSGGTITITKVN